MFSVVLDTIVLVSGLISTQGNSAKIIDAFRDRQLSLFYNDEIMAEYRDVLFRARLSLASGDIKELLSGISRFGISIVPGKSSFIMPDESDRIFYDTAKACGGYLVTGNAKHFPDELFIMTPARFWEILEA